MRGHRRGFTLIELLVVVAVIALLVSILLPSLTNARKQAQAIVCMSQNQQIYLGMTAYQYDHKGYLPPTLWSEWDHDYPNSDPLLDDSAKKYDLWFYKLCDPSRGKKYIANPRVLVCPGDPFKDRFDFEAAHPSPLAKYPHMIVAVPSCGYGVNYLLRHWAHGLSRGSTRPSYNIERFPPKRPYATILMAEVGPDDRLYRRSLGQSVGQPWRDGGRLVWDDGVRPWTPNTASNPWPSWLTARHLGRINMTAMEGSVRRVWTLDQVRSGVNPRPPYADCQSGECYFCNYERTTPHYNFAQSRLYWWVGPMPNYPL